MDKIQKITAAFYVKNTDRWSSSHSNSFFHEEPFKKFLRLIPKNGTIIDIGCASGIHVPVFLGIGRKLGYEGLDTSRNSLKIAKVRYPQLKFRQGDITDRKSLPRKKYDGFWAVAVLQHIPKADWPIMISNLNMLSKNSGIGYITVPETRPTPESAKDKRYFELFDDKKFKDMLSGSGWKILESGEMQGKTGQAVWRWYIVKVLR